jgi:hypothetical protein
MSVREAARALFIKRLRNAPTTEQSVDEAASHQLGSQSKIAAATDLVFLDDMRRIARDERENVQHYRERLGLAPRRASRRGRDNEMSGDLILCDDYRPGINGTVAAIIVAAALVCCLVVAAIAAWPRNSDRGPDTDTQYQLELVNGEQ